MSRKYDLNKMDLFGENGAKFGQRLRGGKETCQKRLLRNEVLAGNLRPGLKQLILCLKGKLWRTVTAKFRWCENWAWQSGGGPLYRALFSSFDSFFFSLYGSSYDLWRELALYLVAWFLFIILIYFKILSGQKNVEARYPDVPVMVWWTPFSGCYISLHGWSTFSLALFAKSVVTVVKTWILRM